MSEEAAPDEEDGVDRRKLLVVAGVLAAKQAYGGDDAQV